MNWDQIEGNWKQFKGEVKEKWGKFTDDDLDVISGKRDKLIGKLQEKYGIAREEAEAQLKKFQEQSRTSPEGRPRSGGGKRHETESLL